ncbi:hypothetical protein M407DRAFT_74508 [Tulasnella calospora MUT 4182]|uniref:ATP binding protein n=1 Tax=Tulasnella calospora MUT 4182 TaxID=1051891 RepID=A0A0C3QJM6_9AGAM|nr:hypothetical protein M407DRAFT_74508 [Tulasnella calospora MUT 4182]
MAQPLPRPSASSHPSHPAPASSTSEGTSRLDEGEGTPADVGMLREIAKRGLIDSLNAINGAKTLVLDPSLAGPLGLVTEVALLKQHGVDKMFWLESGPLNAQTTNVVYLCRPQVKWMKIIADQIKQLGAGSSPHTYHLILVPRRTTLCDRVLEEEGVFGEITISNYKLEFIPLEDDLLSLEWESTYKEIFLDGDETAVYYAAQALLTLQQAYGLFPRIIGKGDGAKKLADLLVHLRAHPADPAQAQHPNLQTQSEIFDSLIIIDRSVDMVTPLLTQLTYQGLLDEVLGVKNSHIEVDAAIFNPTNTATSAGPSASTSLATTPAAPPKKKKHRLTAETDGLFTQIRDANFAIVGTKLNREARRLDTEYKGRHQAQTVAQLRDFVGKLGGLQNEQTNLRLHTDLSEKIALFTQTEMFNKSLEIQQNLLASYEPTVQVSAIEDLISQEAPLQLVLRLLCLASLTNGGIKAKTLENIKREILQTYGYSYLPLLLALTSLSLLLPNPLPKSLTNQSSASDARRSSSLKPPAVPPAFAPIRKAFRILSDTPEATPTDVSYVYSGYAPLSLRIVQAVAMKGLVLANLPLSDGSSRSGPLLEAGAGAKKEAKVESVACHPINGWKGFEEVVKLLPGGVVDQVQVNGEGHQRGGGESNPTTTTVVFFLGGCTYTEVSALRWMTQHCKGRRFLIGSTSMISGGLLIETLNPLTPTLSLTVSNLV